MNQTWDIVKAVEAQKKYCEEKGQPHFAPKDGRCWKCRHNIYKSIDHTYGERSYKTGITVEKAGSELVTGCPHCNRSYCD